MRKSGFSKVVEAERAIREERLGGTPENSVYRVKKRTGVRSMFFYKKFEIGDNERALLFKGKKFHSILNTGTYRYFGLPAKQRAAIFDLTKPELRHPLVELLYKENRSLFEKHVQCYHLSDVEIGLVYFDDNLVDILAPGVTAFYWKGHISVRVEKINISENLELLDEQRELLRQPRSLRSGETTTTFVNYHEVPTKHVALLSINGVQQRVLKAGNYAFWRPNRSITIRPIDCRVQAMEISGQEILTKDKVSLRINLTANYRVLDPEKAVNELSDYQDFLYKELQFALRESVGTKMLDELLANKEQLRVEVDQYIQRAVKEYGLEVQSLGVKDIILPGDMKTILNQVVEAEKAAEANIIRRREETAATRSLHNTAKMMDNNPTLLRLKELEVLERVTEKINNITVFGGLEGILNDFVKLPRQ